MPVCTKDSDQVLPSHIKDVYLKDYDLHTLKSLVRNFGEEEAANILQSCARNVIFQQFVKDPQWLVKAKKEYKKIYGNILTLVFQAGMLYKNDKRAIDFTMEAMEGVKVYHKSSEEMRLEDERNGPFKFDNRKIRKHNDAAVFRACYALASIYQMPQRYAIVETLNILLRRGGLQSVLKSEPLNDIPREARGLYAFNQLTQFAVREVVDQDTVQMIDSRGRNHLIHTNFANLYDEAFNTFLQPFIILN